MFTFCVFALYFLYYCFYSFQMYWGIGNHIHGVYKAGQIYCLGQTVIFGLYLFYYLPREGDYEMMPVCACVRACSCLRI